MKEVYESIANELDLPANGVHLVHFVLKNMKETCVFPPRPKQKLEPFYTPVHICACLFAYLEIQFPENPWTVFSDFGLKSSEDIGRVVFAVQQHENAKVVAKLDVDIEAYRGIFDPETRSGDLLNVRWHRSSEENLFPTHVTTSVLLKRHFGCPSLDSLVISQRQFPGHVRADVQRALNALLGDTQSTELFGINSRHASQGIDFNALIENDPRTATKIGPLQYSEIDVGNNETVSCQSNGLWLAANCGEAYAVVLGTPPAFRERGQIQLEIAVTDVEGQRKFAEQFLIDVQRQVEASSCYRGKVLSFEQESDYRGYSAGIKVHELKTVARDEVILPQQTLNLLDRNVINFVQQRPHLAKRGMNLKKGILLWGPPGTGKTHTVNYLSQALPGTTTLVITSEQIRYLSEYMNLARLLQPSLVIIEDADLIARQREYTDSCGEALLNKLLNEMDGLRSDAEIIFVLTTNRPETLEEALTARPGRIDQAIEYPLPDTDGRRRLATLYAGNQEIAENVLASIVSRTDRTSAAFIKELMRRATQYAIARGAEEPISTGDVEVAVEEMLFSGGHFNRQILGGSSLADE